MHAETCPVCDGRGHDGKICELDGFYTVCIGCNNKGWVEVSDEPTPPSDKVLVTNSPKTEILKVLGSEEGEKIILEHINKPVDKHVVPPEFDSQR